MTEENNRLRDKVKEAESIAAKGLASQPDDDNACKVHLMRVLESISAVVDTGTTPEKTARDLEDMTNSFSCREPLGDLANRMTTMHRTLVQSFAGGFVIPFVRELAKMHRCGFTDPRDQAAGEACVAMCEALERKYDVKEDEELHFACI